MAPSIISAIQSFLQATLVVGTVFSCLVDASVSDDLRYNYLAPAPAPQDGPAFSAKALRNPKYLPLEVGAIVGAYVLSLVFVALVLLSLGKRRRGRLAADSQDEADAYAAALEQICSPRYPGYPPVSETDKLPLVGSATARKIPNFSYKSPTRSEFGGGVSNVEPAVSPASVGAPGVDPLVDQSIVAADREMAQNKLEEMYRHVMEHEEAKEKGIILELPVAMAVAGPAQQRGSGQSKKGKPQSLDLHGAKEERSKSRTSAFLSGLRSPRRNKPKGVNISSPIMTPQTGTFSRQDVQELEAIPLRHYAPAAPPPVPTDQEPFAGHGRAGGAVVGPHASDDESSGHIQSIDGRLGAAGAGASQAQAQAQMEAEADPQSAVSERSQAPLMGLPLSPKPGATFGGGGGCGDGLPSLPSSPRPGAQFQQRISPPSAVRMGGTLPLRAYEPAVGSASVMKQTVKQTVFERRGPLSAGPGTAGAVPYSAYQPYTPCVPITPCLVTKEDRKRMKKMVPKTPTVEMVQSEEDVW